MIKAKERRLRLLLKHFCEETQEGEWITPLNPSNIQLDFTDLYKNDESMLFCDVIYLDPDHEAKHLFPYLVKELYLIKQKREHRFEYFVNRIFGIGSIMDKANEKQETAFNWIARKEEAKYVRTDK